MVKIISHRFKGQLMALNTSKGKKTSKKAGLNSLKRNFLTEIT
jgi:hypothetical protein